jgi:hypothetical protein
MAAVVAGVKGRWARAVAGRGSLRGGTHRSLGDGATLPQRPPTPNPCKSIPPHPARAAWARLGAVPRIVGIDSAGLLFASLASRARQQTSAAAWSGRGGFESLSGAVGEKRSRCLAPDEKRGWLAGCVAGACGGPWAVHAHSPATTPPPENRLLRLQVSGCPLPATPTPRPPPLPALPWPSKPCQLRKPT